MGEEGKRSLVLETERLRLTAMTLAALQAWVDGDATALLRETGARFDEPVASPPLFGVDLPSFRDRMAETPEEVGWWVWLISRKEDGRALGVCGLGGKPGPRGTAVMGYAVYPCFQGRGYATEASRALLGWVLAQRGTMAVRVTVPLGNGASAAVARKLGMVSVGVERHPEAGDVAVYEVGESP